MDITDTPGRPGLQGSRGSREDEAQTPGGPANPADESEALRQLAPPDGPAERRVLERLQGELSQRAGREGLLDLAYSVLDSPLGALLLVATEAGLVRIGFECEGHDQVLDRLAAGISPRLMRHPEALSEPARQLEEYFDGRRQIFDVALDMRLARGFRAEVLAYLRQIPYGRVQSYAQVATGVGNPRAARAVGSACATNPVPVIVPCHRVVRSGGSIGRYGGGEAAKAMLLELEATPEA